MNTDKNVNMFLFFYHRALFCCMLVALSEDKTPIDFRFTRSNVKVSIVTL